MPAFFSGLRIAATYSVIGAIFGEYVGAEKGLGIYMQRATNSFAISHVFAAIVVTAVLSLLLFGLVSLIERIALPWYHGATYRPRLKVATPLVGVSSIYLMRCAYRKTGRPQGASLLELEELS